MAAREVKEQMSEIFLEEEVSEEEGNCSHVKDDLKWGVGEGNDLEFLTSMSAVLSRSVCAFERIAKFDRKNKPFKHTSVKRNVKPLPIAWFRHPMHYKSSYHQNNACLITRSL